MRTGVRGFTGAKLAEARAARGITSRKALADLMQRAPSTIIRWEDGETAPEPSALTELAKLLSVPEDFFLSPRGESGGLVFFRSFVAALKSDRMVQETRLMWLADIAAVAEHYAFLPEVDLPEILNGTSYRGLRDEDIERMAQEVRERWNLGLQPIDNMIALLERIGVVVAAEPMETDRLDGLSKWGPDQRPYILLANDKQSYARRQFDCAHELAHLLFHRNVGQEELVANLKQIEDQADRFASAFLLPAKQYPLEVNHPTLYDLERLKSRWKVSIKAQIVRLQRLDILDKEAAVRFYKIYSAKGYARSEPLDASWPLQRPTLLADVFKALVDAGRLTKAILRHDLPLLPHDVESLAGLPGGWLTQETARVIDLKPQPAREPVTAGTGEVISINRPRPLKTS